MQSNNITTEAPKIKLSGTITNQIERDVTLPFFCKYGDSHFFRVDENKNLTAVKTYSFSTSIEYCGKDDTYYGTMAQPETVEITEEEFNQALESVKAKINAL